MIDADERKIGIDRYLLVNPPVDVAYAVKKIDEWSALKRKFGREKSQEIVAQALGVVDTFSSERRDNPAVFDRLAKKLAGFTREELQYLIAENLHSELSELVYVTQVIENQKLLTAPKDDMRKRLEEAKQFTFTNYNQQIGVPRWQKQIGDPQADLDSFIQRGSLASIADQLRDNPKVHILHNADDFLAERKSIDALKDDLSDRVTLFPYGGHLGNLWYPENKEYAFNFFRARR